VTVCLLPYWCDAIVPDLYRHGCVLVASHGNALRALVKHLEGVSAGLEIPNAAPLCYRFESGHAIRLS
jgi:2,3-bisphosphoglycerate-dependent phosphoglycerate mutase